MNIAMQHVMDAVRDLGISSEGLDRHEDSFDNNADEATFAVAEGRRRIQLRCKPHHRNTGGRMKPAMQILVDAAADFNLSPESIDDYFHQFDGGSPEDLEGLNVITTAFENSDVIKMFATIAGVDAAALAVIAALGFGYAAEKGGNV